MNSRRARLAEALAGKTVLLVVDRVQDGQLKNILPHNIMGIVGEDSVVLVASRA